MQTMKQTVKELLEHEIYPRLDKGTALSDLNPQTSYKSRRKLPFNTPTNLVRVRTS